MGVTSSKSLASLLRIETRTGFLFFHSLLQQTRQQRLSRCRYSAANKIAGFAPEVYANLIVIYSSPEKLPPFKVVSS
jgi:hypothetical protein